MQEKSKIWFRILRFFVNNVFFWELLILSNRGAGAEDGGNTGFVQEIVILSRDYTAGTPISTTHAGPNPPAKNTESDEIQPIIPQKFANVGFFLYLCGAHRRKTRKHPYYARQFYVLQPDQTLFW